MSRNPELPDLFTADEWLAVSRQVRMTPREREVARLLCKGHTNRSIARRLELAGDTVRMHVRKLYRRLGVHTRIGVPVTLVHEIRKVMDLKKKA